MYFLFMLNISNFSIESDIFISVPFSRTLGLDSCLYSLLIEFYKEIHDPFEDSLFGSPSQISHLNKDLFIF